jgi:ADP-ribose pyrophosphatase
MPNVEKITKQTENPFVNLYLVEGTNKVNHHFRYYVASRAKSIEQMKIKTRKNTPDGVLMYSLYGEKRDKIVLVRQYRVSIDDYIYEFPAGLVEPGEEFHEAAVREMHEETGLTFHPLKVDPCYEKPFFTTSRFPIRAAIKGSSMMSVLHSMRASIRHLSASTAPENPPLSS